MGLWMTLALAATAAGGCPKGHDAATEKGLLQTETRWISALEARDVAALDCLLDVSFTDNAAQGLVRNKSEVLARLPKRPPGTIEIREVSARVAGPMGFVRGLSVNRDENGSVVAKALFTDIFLRRDGRWVVIAAQETPASGA